MTDQDYINYCMEKAKREAEDVLAHYLKPFDMVKERFFPNNTTIERFDEMLREMGDEDGLGGERIKELRKIQEDLEKEDLASEEDKL